MKSYWLWLLFNVIVWPFALLYFDLNNHTMIGNLFAVAFYFIIFFITPLIQQKPMALLSFLGLKSIIVILILFSHSNIGFNPFLLLIMTLVMAEGFYHLNPKASTILAGFISITMMGSTFIIESDAYIQIWISLYFLLMFIGMLFYKKHKLHTDDVDARYDALLSEYRELKRRKVSEDEVTRQEERMIIAREIHDSVGHKLTALVMQLEAFRIDVSEKDREQVQVLKELASESLEETRRAVKSLKSTETGGLPGILRLIRKLEMESFMRIHFSIKHGAFTAPLSGEQSFIIYRSVQEALTNSMKHSEAREAEITFDAPGGSIFRFEMTNPITNSHRFQEGFGLTSMRDRLEKLGGGLEVIQTDEEFIVRGYLKLDRR